MSIDRVILLVIDGLGVGECPGAGMFDQAKYDPSGRLIRDTGANTLLHLAQERSLDIQILQQMGLGNSAALAGKSTRIAVPGVKAVNYPSAAYGIVQPWSPARDTCVMHREMVGVIPDSPPSLYPGGFPESMLEDIFTLDFGTEVESLIREGKITREQALNFLTEDYRLKGYIKEANQVISGTTVLEEYGERCREEGRLIFYTSADSVFQVAYPEDLLPNPLAYAILEKMRALVNPTNPRHSGETIMRFIARPFLPTGSKTGNKFKRTDNRNDFALPVLEREKPTLLNLLYDGGYICVGVGPVPSFFAHEGFTSEENDYGVNNTNTMAKLLKLLTQEYHGDKGLLFVNLEETDMKAGHRRDTAEYQRLLEQIDKWLPDLFMAMASNDLLIVTSDHGNDPTHGGANHTREYTPLLVYNPLIAGVFLHSEIRVDLGVRQTLADIGQTIADIFDVGQLKNGRSFYGPLREYLTD